MAVTRSGEVVRRPEPKPEIDKAFTQLSAPWPDGWRLMNLGVNDRGVYGQITNGIRHDSNYSIPKETATLRELAEQLVALADATAVLTDEALTSYEAALYVDLCRVLKGVFDG